jgi:general transcription factor 3C protein 4
LFVDFHVQLDRTLILATTAAGLAPLYLLRPFFFRLRDKKMLSVLHSRVLDVITPEFSDHSALVTVSSWANLTPETQSQFRASMASNLFGWDILLSLRMRLSLADFAWVSSIYTDRIVCSHYMRLETL